MKSVYRRAVAERFHAAFLEQFPQFVLRPGRDRDMPGSRLYRRVVSDSLVIFVYLIIHDNADEFNIDIGHGPSESPPIESFFAKPAEMIANPASLFRLTEFWADRDPWWVVEPFTAGNAAPPEQLCQPRVEVLVTDAVARLAEHGKPYFAQVVMRHGGSGASTAV